MTEETLDSYEQEVTLDLRRATERLREAEQLRNDASRDLAYAEVAVDAARQLLARASLSFRRVVLQEYVPEEPAAADSGTSPGLVTQ